MCMAEASQDFQSMGHLICHHNCHCSHRVCLGQRRRCSRACPSAHGDWAWSNWGVKMDVETVCCIKKLWFLFLVWLNDLSVKFGTKMRRIPMWANNATLPRYASTGPFWAVMVGQNTWLQPPYAPLPCGSSTKCSRPVFKALCSTFNKDWNKTFG